MSAMNNSAIQKHQERAINLVHLLQIALGYEEELHAKYSYTSINRHGLIGTLEIIGHELLMMDIAMRESEQQELPAK
jgi:hypothetical protein